MTEKHTFGLTHTTIPGEVAFNFDLTETDKFIWWIINILDTTEKHCFASNKYIAQRALCNERSVTRAITKLIKLGYVVEMNLNGNIRVLKIEKDLEKFRYILLAYNDLFSNGEMSGGHRHECRGDIKFNSNKINNNENKASSKEEAAGTEPATSKVGLRLRKQTPKQAPVLCIRKSQEEEEEEARALLKKKTAEACKKKDEENKKPPIIIPKNILPYIEIWENLGLTKHARNTNTFKQIVRNLKRLVSHGDFFENMDDYKSLEKYKLTLLDWEMVLERYLMSLQPEYLPRNKTALKNTTLLKFLYNRFIESPILRSPLAYFLQNPPQPTVTPLFPDITSALIKKFGNDIISTPNYKPVGQDIIKFIQAGNNIGEYFKKNRKRIGEHFLIRWGNGKSLHNKYAELTIKAVLKDVGGSAFIVTPGYFCSNKTFDMRLPVYLKSQAIFSSTANNGNGVGQRYETKKA